jgi:O-antigen/teichoic acid export membrane protein
MLALLARGRWILIDQILSSGTNFVLSFVLVRAVSPRQFGAFGVAFVTYQLILSLARAQASEPMTIRFSDTGKPEWVRAASHSTGFALALGLVAGAGLVLFGLSTDGALRTSFLAMGIVTPGLLVQDGWRYAFFSLGTPARAAANDLVLAAVQFALLAGIVVAGAVSIPAAVFAWGVAALVAAAAGAFQAGCVPSLRHAATWAKENRGLGGVLTGDLMVRGAASQIALFVVGALAGLASVGYVRAGLLLFGPLTALIQGAVPFAVTEFVRLKSSAPSRLRPASDLLSVLFAAGGLALGLAVMLLPDDLGRTILGESWAGTRDLLPAMTAFAVTAGVVVGPAVGLRALPAVGRLVTVSLVVAPVTILLMGGGAFLSGAEGATWGLAAANAVTAAALVWQFRAAMRSAEAAPGAVTSER